MAEDVKTADASEAAVTDESLSIEVTSRCTQKCLHCFVRAARSRESDLPLAAAQQIADEGLSAGYRHLHLTGGDPFLWPHLQQFLEYCGGAGYDTLFINTNGLHLDGDMLDRLKGFGDRLSLSISLQGPAEIHDAFRGAGSHGQAIGAIERTIAAGIPLHIFTTVSRGLVPLLPRFAEFVFTGFPETRDLTLIQLIRVKDDALDLADHLLTPEDFIVMVRSAAMLNLIGYRIHVLDNPLAAASSLAMGMPWLAKTGHLHRPGRVTILADGKITIAHSTTESFGNYIPGKLKELLGSGPYRDAVSPDTAACPACRHHGLCAPHGMLRPSEKFRSMNEKEFFCRRVMDCINE